MLVCLNGKVTGWWNGPDGCKSNLITVDSTRPKGESPAKTAKSFENKPASIWQNSKVLLTNGWRWFAWKTFCIKRPSIINQMRCKSTLLECEGLSLSQNWVPILLTQGPICKILVTIAQLLGVVEKLSFFESAILNFFFKKKKKNFASSPWKLVTNYMLEWMGLNF